MNYRDELKLRSYINGVWNDQLFMEEWKAGLHGSLLPAIHSINKVVFYRELAQDRFVTTQILPEQTASGKTKLVIKINIQSLW